MSRSNIVSQLKNSNKIGKKIKDTVNSSLYYSNDNKRVFKIFNYSSQNIDKILKRKENFDREIKTLIELNKKGIKGIPYIISFEIEENYSYYEMPLYSIYKVKDVSTILHDFVLLFDVLDEIHKADIAHLDIKPDNIMHDGKMNLILIDFGCSHKLDDEINEDLGGKWYAPKELRNVYSKLCRFDFKKSDIYMMNKTLWSLLAKDNYGKTFYGEFKRSDIISISENFCCNCEPLCILFENTIIDEIDARFCINECKKYLNYQIEKCEGISKFTKDINYELVSVLHSLKPSIIHYDEPSSIIKIMKAVKKIRIVESEEKEKFKNIVLQIKNCEELFGDKKIFKLKLDTETQKVYVLIKIMSIKIEKQHNGNSSVMEILLSDDNELEQHCKSINYRHDNILFPESGDYYLNHKYQLEILFNPEEEISLNSL